YTHDFNLDTQGTWFRLPVNAGNFYYNGSDNFVVEISFGPERVVNSILVAAQGISGGAQRMLPGRMDTSVSTAAMPYTFDFGFDQATTGVEALGNIRSFGLFPNPVTDGRFNLSFEAGGPVREAVVTVTNATGQQVLRQRYTDIGSRFFREVDIRGAASGPYFVEVTVDGERIVRRVVVE